MFRRVSLFYWRVAGCQLRNPIYFERGLIIAWILYGPEASKGKASEGCLRQGESKSLNRRLVVVIYFEPLATQYLGTSGPPIG